MRLTHRTAVRAASIALPVVALATVGLLVLWPEEAPPPTPAPPSTLETRLIPVPPAERIDRLPADLFERPPMNGEIRFRSPREAQLRRAQLRRFIFGRARLPSQLPAVDTAIADRKFSDGLTNLERIDRLRITMPLGFESVAYHVIPRRANGRLLIYHGGHFAGLVHARWIVARFLARGYAVAVLAMPYFGRNTSPESMQTRCGRVELRSAGADAHHETLACLPRPLRYFLEPVAVVVNHASTLPYESIAMLGHSGGGWTTLLHAAIDPRVQRSYPVAASAPFHITARTCPGKTPVTVPKCFGDIENRLAAFYRIANYPELYTLGAWGSGRNQLAVNNVFDPCCFSGRGFEEWRPQVQGALRTLGSGTYDAVGDTTHRRHILSPFALETIEADLERT